MLRRTTTRTSAGSSCGMGPKQPWRRAMLEGCRRKISKQVFRQNCEPYIAQKRLDGLLDLVFICSLSDAEPHQILRQEVSL